MKHFKITNHMFFLAVIFILVMGIDAKVIGAEKTAATPEGVNKECNLKIEGMTCGMCEAMIKKALKDSTVSAEIDHKAGTGKVTYVEGNTTCAAVVDKVNETGFKAVVVQ